MTLALLRAASNNLYAVGRTYYTFDVYAKNRGLCPHMKNHPLGGWMFIFYQFPQGVQNEHSYRVHFFEMKGLGSCTCSHRVDVDGLTVRAASLLVFDVNSLLVLM